MFIDHREGSCCLCGATQNLTGEHKIKRSAISSQFGNEKMVIGHFERADDPYRNVQGPKSKNLHFRSRICKNCNDTLTQPADRQFDILFQEVNKCFQANEDPQNMFNQVYEEGTCEYLNIYRYFSKLMVCHMAEIEAPRLVSLCEFVLGKSDRNRLNLKIDADWVYTQYRALTGEHDYAAHGGLVIYGDKVTGAPNGFHSTLTLGEARYVFSFRLSAWETLYIQTIFPEFFEKCREAVMNAKQNPLNEGQLKRLALE
ncbi:hypothetical protein [Hirschia litorea]|uniref:HNH endonuclease 5 domain-containing protein n=1 Tax=Hirschia litorea TaxID=1199156 RepID=A0ABW2IL14_9PROT